MFCLFVDAVIERVHYRGEMDQEEAGKGTDGAGSGVPVGVHPGQGPDVALGVCASSHRFSVKWKEGYQHRRQEDGDTGSLKREKLYTSRPGGENKCIRGLPCTHHQHRALLWSEVTDLTARRARVAPTAQVQVQGSG